ncbi:MAG: thioredoxin family protein [Verrucomicrobiae bacterium]|nr:thioredoxin family protein [Verrucomicrobiae bacterium]
MKKCTFWFLLAAAIVWGAGWLTLRCQAQPWAPEPEPAPGTEIKWLTDYDAALKQAQASNQLVVIDFYTTWCGPCKMMDKITFADANVRARLAGFVPLKIDGDKHPELVAKYGPPAWPTMLVIDATGKPILGTVGYVPPDFYLEVIKQAELKNAGTNSVKTAAPPAASSTSPIPAAASTRSGST